MNNVSEEIFSTEQDVAERIHEQEIDNLRKSVAHVGETAVCEDEEDEDVIFPGTEDDETSTSLSVLKPEYYRLPAWRRPYPFLLVLASCIGSTGEICGATSLLDLLRSIACRARYPDGGDPDSGLWIPDDRCTNAVVSGDVTAMLSYSAALMGVLGVILTPKITALSDRVGRMPILRAYAFTSAIASAVIFLLFMFPGQLGVPCFYLAQFLASSMGGMITFMLVIKSYITDCVRPVHRTRYIGYMDAVMSISLTLGPTIGAFLTRVTGSITTTIVVSCSAPAFMLLILCFTPESRTEKARRESQASYASSRASNVTDHLNTTEKLRHIISNLNFLAPLKKLAFSNIESKKDRKNAWLLVFFLFFASEIGMGVGNLFLIYPELKFGWTSVETGYSLTVFGLFKTLNLIILLPFMIKMLSKLWHLSVKRLDMIDATIIRVSLVGSVIGFGTVAFASTGTMFVMGISIIQVTSAVGPAVTSALIKFVNKEEVGEVLGAVGFLMNLGGITSPVIFMQIFTHTAESNPNMVFKVVMFLNFVLFLITSLMLPVRSENEDERHVFQPAQVVYRREYRDEEEDETDPLLSRASSSRHEEISHHTETHTA